MLSRADWLAIVGIVASPVTGIIGFLLGYAAKRPRLEITGVGSGSNRVGDRDLMLSDVYIYNNPKFLGVRMGRESAKLIEAGIYDPELEELVGHGLLWAVEGSQELVRTTTIDSGTQARLYVFAKDRYQDEFFVYYAAALNSDPPRSPARYTEKKKSFGLMLRDVQGRQYNFQLVVRNTDQSVNIRTAISLRERMRRLFRIGS